MTTAAQLIKQLIDQSTSRIRTIDIGIITGVKSYASATVKIKHLTSGQVVEYADVPVLPQGIGSARIYAMPRIGDTVIVAYLQYDTGPQLENKTTVTAVNEQVKYSHPVILTAIDTTDDPPEITPAAGETLIVHSASSYIRFTSNGNIAIVAPQITANGTPIPQPL